MIIMQVNNLSKSFGATSVLNNINLEIKSNERIAIVGRNGCGKSTLLKIMAGKLPYETGEVIKPRNLTIGYLSQHTDLQSDETIWNEMENVFKHLLEKQKQLRSLEQKMQQVSEHEEQQNLLIQYDVLQRKFELERGYTYDASIKAVLSGLNFHEEDYNIKINTLSGGQKTRLALGKLLLQEPQLLILDEPTNHLDIETMAWLESFLKSYPGAVTIVSHDRYFLEQTISTIYEISYHQMKKYVGGYKRFLQLRESHYTQQLKMYEQQQQEIKQAEEFIERNIARASTTRRAQSRRRQLENLERIEKPLGDEASAKFSFEINRRSGNDVLKVNDVAFSYDKVQPMFSNINFHVNRGDRIAIVGPNGIGKTTLLKLIVNKLTPDTGLIEHGTNVQVGYYDQEQQFLTPTNTILNELWDEFPNIDERDIRTVLGNFLFSGEAVLDTVYSLSGGEKARLSLAKLMLKKANMLVLDEPTNHLDIDSKEILESALVNYPGTIIFVSHDRYFINKIANHVVEISSTGSTVYLGDYDYFVEKKQEERERELLKEKRENTVIKDEQTDRQNQFEEMKKQQREQRRKKRKIEEIEKDIEQLENKLAQIETQMTDPDVFQDHEKSLELSKKADHLREQIDKLMDHWTILQS